MKPIFNKIFNQIDKIYSEQTGMIYPVSAAVGGGPVPPGPDSKIFVKGVYMSYAGNVSSFKEVWDVKISLTFNEPAPEGWQGYVTMPNVYVAEYGPEPHPYEVVDIPFEEMNRMGAYLMSSEPAWVIGDFPTTAHIKIMVGDEVWTECDITNVVNITDNNPDRISLVDNTITFTGNQDGTYDVSFTADNFSFSSLANGWSACIEVPNYETYIHQEIMFDNSNVINGSEVVIPGVTLLNPVNEGDYLNGYVYDNAGVQTYGFNGQSTVVPFDPDNIFGSVDVEFTTEQNNL